MPQIQDQLHSSYQTCKPTLSCWKFCAFFSYYSHAWHYNTCHVWSHFLAYEELHSAGSGANGEIISSSISSGCDDEPNNALFQVYVGLRMHRSVTPKITKIP